MFSNRRMYRIFRDDGRSVVVALDHAVGTDVHPSLSEPARVIDAIAAGGADAILTTAGVVKQFPHHLKSLGVILRADGGNSQLEGGVPDHRLMHSVEDALRLGADAVGCMGFPGAPLEARTLQILASLAGECQRWGVPLMAEMLPGGFTDFSLHTAENIRLAVRIGVELGADFIKTEFTGSAESFRQVTENCYRPVLVLGGGRMDELALFGMVKTAMEAGAAGAVIGRNIWGHPRPQAMVSALNLLIHHDASVDEAMDELSSAR
jgi:class I fructose-bisphosphate aldolase